LIHIMCNSTIGKGNRWILAVLAALLTACGAIAERGETRDENNLDDPYRQFSQAVATLEPLPQKLDEDTDSQDRQASDRVRLPPVNPLEIEGNIALAGNSAIHPLHDLMYERFVRLGYAGKIDLDRLNATAAVRLFCRGQKFDAIAITRPLTEPEQATCAGNGRQPLEFPIGRDALAIVANRQDTFVKKVTLAKLREILTRRTWSEVDPNWPNEPIERFLVGPRSAAVELLGEKVFDGETNPIRTAPNTNFYQYDEPMIQALSTTRYSVGVMSYSTYLRVSRSFRAIALDGESASLTAARRGTYPLGRTLYLYADIKTLRQKPQVKAFLNFYLANLEEEIEKANLFPLSPEELNASKQQWLKVN